MRIGIVAPFNPSSIQMYFEETLKSLNKTASSVNNLVLSFINQGHDVCVFTLDTTCKETKFYNSDHVSLYVIGVRSSFKLNNYFPSLNKQAQTIKHYIKKEIGSLDILHAHWCYQYALSVIEFTSILPVFCTIRDIASVIYKNAKLSWRPYHLLNKLYWRYRIKIFEQVINNKSIHFIANSEYTFNYFKSRFPNRECALLYNSIADNRVLNHRIAESVNAQFVTIAADVDDRRKNIFTLIEAFAVVKKEIKSSKLVIIGHYRKGRGVYELAKKKDLLDGVSFMGLMNHNELMDIIDHSACLVHPATEETFGNTLIEAMSRCVPVIGGNRSGAVPHILDNGECGFVCDITSKEQLSATMLNVLEDKVQTVVIVNNATKRLKEKYINSVVGKEHISLYSRIINEDGSL